MAFKNTLFGNIFISPHEYYSTVFKTVPPPDSMTFFFSWQALVSLIGSGEQNHYYRLFPQFIEVHCTYSRTGITVSERKCLSQHTTCSLGY